MNQPACVGGCAEGDGRVAHCSDDGVYGHIDMRQAPSVTVTLHVCADTRKCTRWACLCPVRCSSVDLRAAGMPFGVITRACGSPVCDAHNRCSSRGWGIRTQPSSQPAIGYMHGAADLGVGFTNEVACKKPGSRPLRMPSTLDSACTDTRLSVDDGCAYDPSRTPAAAIVRAAPEQRSGFH